MDEPIKKQGKIDFADLDGLSTQVADIMSNTTNQLDFIRYIEENKSYDWAKFWIDRTTVNRLNFGFYDGDNNCVINHSIEKDIDDFIKWTKSNVNNSESDYRVETFGIDNLTFTGTFNGLTGANYWTTVIGDTAEASIYGSALWVCTYSDDRGGLWGVTIDGEPSDNISTWAESSGTLYTKIAEDLSSKEPHGVKLTFLGDDPDHEPSTGIGTARGWLRDSVDSEGNQRTITSTFARTDDDYEVLTKGSNRDFAFLIAYDGAEEFIPSHNSVASVTKISDPVYKIDGVITDISTIDTFKLIDFDTVECTQNFYGVISSTNVVEMTHITKIESNGLITISGDCEFLQDVTINDGYTPMLPLNNGVLETAISSRRTIKETEKNDGRFNFKTDRDESIGMCGIDATNKDLIAAYKIHYIQRNNRYSEYKQSDKILFGNMNSSKYFKIYNEPFKNSEVVTGEEYGFKSLFSIAMISDVYSKFI